MDTWTVSSSLIYIKSAEQKNLGKGSSLSLKLEICLLNVILSLVDTLWKCFTAIKPSQELSLKQRMCCWAEPIRAQGLLFLCTGGLLLTGLRELSVKQMEEQEMNQRSHKKVFFRSQIDSTASRASALHAVIPGFYPGHPIWYPEPNRSDSLKPSQE